MKTEQMITLICSKDARPITKEQKREVVRRLKEADELEDLVQVLRTIIKYLDLKIKEGMTRQEKVKARLRAIPTIKDLERILENK